MHAKFLFALSLLAAVFVLASPSFADAEDPEILYLLDAVDGSACVFIRNGSRYDAAKAADHLRMKYQRGRRYATSAETFIERLASKSSISKKPYMMECPGKPAEPTGEWLMQRLAEFRKGQA